MFVFVKVLGVFIVLLAVDFNHKTDIWQEEVSPERGRPGARQRDFLEHGLVRQISGYNLAR